MSVIKKEGAESKDIMQVLQTYFETEIKRVFKNRIAAVINKNAFVIDLTNGERFSNITFSLCTLDILLVEKGINLLLNKIEQYIDNELVSFRSFGIDFDDHKFYFYARAAKIPKAAAKVLTREMIGDDMQDKHFKDVIGV